MKIFIITFLLFIPINSNAEIIKIGKVNNTTIFIDSNSIESSDYISIIDEYLMFDKPLSNNVIGLLAKTAYHKYRNSSINISLNEIKLVSDKVVVESVNYSNQKPILFDKNSIGETIKNYLFQNIY